MPGSPHPYPFSANCWLGLPRPPAPVLAPGQGPEGVPVSSPGLAELTFMGLQVLTLDLVDPSLIQ